MLLQTGYTLPEILSLAQDHHLTRLCQSQRGREQCSSGSSIQNEHAGLPVTSKHAYRGLAPAIKIAGMLWVHPELLVAF